MKLLKTAGLATMLAGLAGLAIAFAPSVRASAATPGAGAGAQSAARELTIRAGRGTELGVSIVDAKSDGVEIEEVSPNGAAEKAGLKRGDLILEFDGERVRSARQLARLVRETAAGRTVKTTISRDGRKQEVQLTLADGHDSRVIVGPGDRFLFDDEALRDRLRGFAERLPDIERSLRDLPNFDYGFGLPGMPSGGRLGVTVNELTSQLASYFGVKDGVLVASVAEGSAADKAGIRAGDVITTVNGDRITSSADLIRTLRRVANEDVSIAIVRDRKEQTLKVRVEAPRRTTRSARPA